MMHIPVGVLATASFLIAIVISHFIYHYFFLSRPLASSFCASDDGTHPITNPTSRDSCDSEREDRVTVSRSDSRPACASQLQSLSSPGSEFQIDKSDLTVAKSPALEESSAIRQVISTVTGYVVSLLCAQVITHY
jgi:hypothetical protein